MKPDFITEIDWQILKAKYPNNLEEVINKLNQHYPVQYLIGDVEFLNTKILVDERVLIPRFETEYLVDILIKKIQNSSLKNPKIVDLGTGSGCIAIALKKNLNCSVTGVDISESAIELAKLNAEKNHVEINFKINDMLKENYEGYDVIVSNPPYVKEREEVGAETKFEPQNALFAKNDGLFFYEEILKKVSELSIKPKIVAFEIGMTQKEDIISLASKYIPSAKITAKKDLTNRDRYIFIEFE